MCSAAVGPGGKKGQDCKPEMDSSQNALERDEKIAPLTQEMIAPNLVLSGLEFVLFSCQNVLYIILQFLCIARIISCKIEPDKSLK